MVRKKVVKRKSSGRSRKKSSVQKFEKELVKDVKKVEKWVIERRKFFIKLAWVLGVIVALLIISQIYLRVRGAGM